MSRIGKMPISFSEKVNVEISGNEIRVKWPLWELAYAFTDMVEVSKEDNSVVVTPKNEDAKALWWTTRAIINNMVIWVTEGYKKTLEIVWVGYKFEVSGQKLILSIGYSHKVEMPIPAWIKAELDEKIKNVLHISWIDKQLVWEFASKIRAKKKPEPYKGKGIKYSNEQIRRKAGKTGGK